jgi:exosome complex component RRP41
MDVVRANNNERTRATCSTISFCQRETRTGMTSSIRRTDILALSHLREDGRKPHEIRRVRIQMGPCSTGAGSSGATCSGSAVFEMGLTVALATVRGPLDCARRSDELTDRAAVDASVLVAPFGSADRRVVSTSDRRIVEASNLLRSAMEASILLHLFPRSRIEIIVTILSDDGSRLCAAINAATLALVDAGIPMKDLVCSCSAGYAPGIASGGVEDKDDDMALVDLNRREESTSAGGQAAVNVPVAMMPQRGTVVMAQSESRLPNFDALERVMHAAQGQGPATLRSGALWRLPQRCWRAHEGEMTIVS